MLQQCPLLNVYSSEIKIYIKTKASMMSFLLVLFKTNEN